LVDYGSFFILSLGVWRECRLIERIANGEDSYTQFKVQAVSSKDLAKEFVAFSNAEGGILIFGVSDDGEIKGLGTDEIESLGQLIGNVANDLVKPPIHPLIQIMSIGDEKLVIVSIKNGTSKPYATSSGDYYIKSSSDKKKISQEELRRLFAESKKLFPDEEKVHSTNMNDLNMQLFYKFLERFDKSLYEELQDNKIDLKILLQNFDIMKDEFLTLAGNLIFGINPQNYNKSFYIDCCYFKGDDISGTQYISEKRIDGDFATLYNESMGFMKSNLLSRQEEDNFNSKGVLEINEIVLGELIVNALIHRDYQINKPIQIFIFNNRIEITSPGKLFNSLTVEKIKLGNTIRRNQTLDRICNNILPYTGRGSGIKRALSINPDIEFINDTDKEEFKCIILRS
jgi:predicted HTH transcriptional regulator